MSRPRGHLTIQVFFGGCTWRWLVKNFSGEIIDQGGSKQKRVAQKLARESRERHTAASIEMQGNFAGKRRIWEQVSAPTSKRSFGRI